jgi:hypothetical protein
MQRVRDCRDIQSKIRDMIPAFGLTFAVSVKLLPARAAVSGLASSTMDKGNNISVIIIQIKFNLQIFFMECFPEYLKNIIAYCQLKQFCM